MRLFRRRTSDTAPDPQLTRFAAPEEAAAAAAEDNSDALSTVACQSVVSSPGMTHSKKVAGTGGGGELIVAV